jgi:hypothetical protein
VGRESAVGKMARALTRTRPRVATTEAITALGTLEAGSSRLVPGVGRCMRLAEADRGTSAEAVGIPFVAGVVDSTPLAAAGWRMALGRSRSPLRVAWER